MLSIILDSISSITKYNWEMAALCCFQTDRIASYQIFPAWQWQISTRESLDYSIKIESHHIRRDREEGMRVVNLCRTMILEPHGPFYSNNSVELYKHT
jgi:hypothetical protein